jgi:hypothetical protein
MTWYGNLYYSKYIRSDNKVREPGCVVDLWQSEENIARVVELLENRRLTVSSIAEQANIDREAGKS